MLFGKLNEIKVMKQIKIKIIQFPCQESNQSDWKIGRKINTKFLEAIKELLRCTLSSSLGRSWIFFQYCNIKGTELQLQFYYMASFNTYDYEFLIKCLTEGSLAFKAESIKRLTTLVQNDKKQFQLNSKSILTAMEELYTEERDDLNILCTLLLSQIILTIISKQNEQMIKSKHLKYLIYNLGHPNKPSIRKASHTSLLAFIKTYHNFDAILEQYLDNGFDHENMLIKQKSINSFQSIFILQVGHFNWKSEASKRLLQNMITKAGDDNLQIAKAAAQSLLSLCKHQGIQNTASLINIGFLQKLHDFLTTTQQKLPNADLKLTTDDIKLIMQNIRKKSKQQQLFAKPQAQEQPKEQLKSLEQTTQNLTYQRRLQKIKKSIASEQKQKKLEKQQPAGMNFAKMFGNLNNQSSLKQRTEAVQDILYKIQANKNKPQFQASIKAALPNILRLIKDPNPRIVGLTLRILENVVNQIKSSDIQLQNLIGVIIEKLGDPKISIRQIVSKVIRQLIGKTDKGMWIKELLENIRKNTNTFLKDETLNIIHSIYEENLLSDIKYPVDQLVQKIVVFTDDPKTKIKIRTLDCLAQIVFKSEQIDKYNEYLKKQMSQVFYQMYLEKVTKLIQEKEKKMMLELERKRKVEDSNNFRSTYQQKASSYRKEESEDDSKLNVSLDVVKKRISSLKKKRGALSTQETSSLDRTYRTIQKADISNNVEQDDIILPSLPKNSQTHKLTQRKKFDGSPMKTIQNKKSDYMSREELKPLSEPDKQFKNIIFDLKSGDWKVQFQTINKLRRLTQFNPQLILSAPSTNLHVITLDILALIESLRSSVSKNALICLNQIICALGKQVDPQMEIILEKLMKKSADTNIFISSQVQKCLKTLSITATPVKVLQKLSIYKDSKNFAIKDAYINTLLIMKDEEKIRSKQYGKLAEAMTQFLSQGQIDLRTKAKSGIVDICNKLGDWYRFLRGKVSSSAFKLICDLMTKNSLSSIPTAADVTLTPAKPRKQPTTSGDMRSLTIESKSHEKQQSLIKQRGIRKTFVKVQQFPNQFNEIQGLIDMSSSSQWKKRIQSTQGLKILAIKYPNQFVQYRSSCHFVDIISKQIQQPNLKVSVNAMEIFLEVLDPLQKLVENNLSVICNSIFNSLSSNKVEVKEMGQKCTNAIIAEFEIQTILQHICQGILYSLPKSRIYLLNKLQDQIEGIHNERKQLLFKYVFPLLNKLMDEYKSQLMPHVVNIFSHMYDIMGNNMFSHVTKFKEVRELIGR